MGIKYLQKQLQIRKINNALRGIRKRRELHSKENELITTYYLVIDYF